MRQRSYRRENLTLQDAYNRGAQDQLERNVKELLRVLAGPHHMLAPYIEKQEEPMPLYGSRDSYRFVFAIFDGCHLFQHGCKSDRFAMRSRLPALEGACGSAL
jgi:hypothetical protein